MIDHVITTLIHYFANLPTVDYEHLGEFVVAVIGTPTFVQILKHFKNWHEEKVLIKWLTPISGAFAGLIYLHSTGLTNQVSTGNKATLVGAITWLSTVAYDIAVSPLYKKFITSWAASNAEANAYLNETRGTVPVQAAAPTETNPAPIPSPATPVDANFNV